MIENDIKMYEQRLLVITSKNIFYRIFNALKLYFNGGYDSFNGFKSCMSDALRS